MNTLSGKVVLVTGAGRGLGAAICKNLAREGAITILTDLSEDALEKTTVSLTTAGYSARNFLMDVSNEENVKEVINKAVTEFGRLDVVINNAGIDYTKSVEELTLDEWDRVMSVNLRGPFLVSKTALPYLKKTGHGHIVNIVSTASKRAWANASPYHASKWGLLGLSHALHVECRKQNIKVTAVVAGGMKTPFLLERFPDIDTSLLQDPENVADTIRFVLCQPEATVIPEIMVLPMTETSWP